MAIVIDAKSVIRGGAVAGALTAIAGASYGSIMWVNPYFQTKPPFAEQSKLELVAQIQQQQATSMAAIQQNAAQLAEGFWTNQLILAQQAIRQNPNNLIARQQAALAQQQLDAIHRQLFGK